METIYYTASSLDGYIADPKNSLDWLFQFGPPPEGEIEEFLSHVGAMAMGSTTYQWILDHDSKDGEPPPWPYQQPTWVFSSRSLRPLPGADIRFVSGDVRPVHREMVEAAKGKDLWLVGGGDLVGQFYDQGLLDTIIVTMAPVTLGGGAPLLPRRIVEPPLRLESLRTIGGAFAQMRLRVQREGS